MSELNTHTRAEYARQASTPWRGDNTAVIKPKRVRRPSRDLSVIELECGISEADFDAWQAEQRRLVRQRYGL